MRRPASTAVLSLGLGVLIGPVGFGLLDPAPREDGRLIEAMGEVALLVSLYCVGLRLRTPLEWRLWRAPIRLATAAMLATILLAAGAAHVLLGLSFAQALLLAAILAPTDPVLASELPAVPGADHDDPRFVLTAEGGLNNGLALPAVLFGLGLNGLDGMGPAALGWLSVDLLWAVGAGLALGWLIGTGTARWISRLDEVLAVFVAAALAYGSAVALRADAFLAVFAAGVALSRGGTLRMAIRPRMLSPRILEHARRIERIALTMVIVLVGVLVAATPVRPEMLVFALALLLVARPLAVRIGLVGLPAESWHRRVLAGYGVRGAASLYYLAWGINQGLAAPLAHELMAITLITLAVSVVLHGLSAPPLAGRPIDQES